MGWVERFGEKNNFSRSPFSPLKISPNPTNQNQPIPKRLLLLLFFFIATLFKAQKFNILMPFESANTDLPLFRVFAYYF
jgi:hypothetical protein